MPYVVEERVRYLIWRDPEPDGPVLERRSFIGECDTPTEAAAEVEKLEEIGRLAELMAR